jgi:hypothetical protein
LGVKICQANVIIHCRLVDFDYFHCDIEKLIRENIDNGGVSLSENTKKQRWDMDEFDMDK